MADDDSERRVSERGVSERGASERGDSERGTEELQSAPADTGFASQSRPGLPPRWVAGGRTLSKLDGLGLAARLARLAVVVVLLVGAVVVAAVTVSGVGPPSQDDLRRQAGLFDKRQLLIGVKDDQPGMSLLDNGVYRGFDVEIAYLVAASLGFAPDDVRLLTIESEDRARRQALDVKTKKIVTVDLVVATFSITPAREADPDVSFSAPYLRTEQSVLTRKTSARYEALSDLADRKVCTLNTTTSKQNLEAAGVLPFGKNKISECVRGLESGAYDAVSTDAAILAGFVFENPGKFTIHDIGSEGSELYGINVGTNEALKTLVDLALYRSYTEPTDRRWETAYDTYLRREQPSAMPQQVAVAKQPDVEKPRVRIWPWEDEQ
ncbi:transporter substrate-binding domain-containing protein [Cryptosporangium aurantiacum]|uniref:Glutamate transport system substrate-binding protein n=1 Tax=Cryptosporangium aurantiacum TaxID=134849 RepID=A0A1M7RDA8_9ACTN|nr:transporter substrate-binding domain-containing protein [Cryptosporangium aurantiacum]SHN44180.1 glutamate transport system substrate-binding protein [Cryptosporangium aurantiacum]